MDHRRSSLDRNSLGEVRFAYDYNNRRKNRATLSAQTAPGRSRGNDDRGVNRRWHGSSGQGGCFGHAYSMDHHDRRQRAECGRLEDFSVPAFGLERDANPVLLYPDDPTFADKAIFFGHQLKTLRNVGRVWNIDGCAFRRDI